MDNNTNNTGTAKFTGRDTRTSLVTKCLNEFLKYYDAQAGGLKPYEVERRLTSQINDEIIEHNAVCSRDKWARYAELPPNVIATLINHIENVAMVSFTEDSSSADEDSDLLAIYCSEGENEGIWETSRSAIVRKIHEYAPLMSVKNVDEVIRTLSAHAKHVHSTTDPNLCPVKNGIFDRRTKSLLPFSPEYIYMYKIQTKYNPNAINVTIKMPDGKYWDCETQLDSFSDDPEMRQLLREILTAAVFPTHRWDKAILPYSTKGNNGKGTYAALIRAMLGSNAWCSISLREFSMDFMCSPLLTSNAVIVDENDVGAYIDSAANFKSCTTHDAITINRKYKTPVKIKWHGFIMECINELPRFHDRSESMLRRFLIIPFEKSFKGVERKYIKEEYLELEAVREYYLKIALESDITELSCPECCKEALSQYRVYNDPLRDFFESQVEQYTAWTTYPLSFIYDHYKAWYAQTHPGGTVLPFPKFRIDLASMAVDSGHWECPGPDKVVHINKNSMAGAEEAIINYQLERYINHAYRGADPVKITDFKRPDVARGVLIRVDEQHPDPQKEPDDDDFTTPSDDNIQDKIINSETTDIYSGVEDTTEIPSSKPNLTKEEKDKIIRDIIRKKQAEQNLNNTDIEDTEPDDIVPPNPMGLEPQTGEEYRQRISTGFVDSYEDITFPDDNIISPYNSSPNSDDGLEI